MRTTTGIVGVLMLFLGFSTALARAEQRPYPPRRAAIVILSYEDSWWSYTGEYAFLWTLTQQLSAKYSDINILHGSQSTIKGISSALTKALKKKIPIDMFFSTHSDGDRIFLAPLKHAGLPDPYEPGWVRPIEFLEPLIKESDKQYLQLAVHFGCENVNADMVDGFVQQLGFKAYVGNDDISTGAYEMNAFIKEWMNCSDLASAVYDTNEELTDTFTHYDAPKAIYRKMGGPSVYVNEMKGYGENLELCYPGQYRNRNSGY